MPPHGWPAIIAFGAIFSVAYVVSGGLIVAHPQVAHLLGTLRARRLSRRSASDREPIE
jgi:hypothetical protein